MTLLDVLTYRGTLVALNGVVLLGSALSLVLVKSAPSILLLASAFGLLAFATTRGHKPLLVSAALANALLLLVSLPFVYFAVVNGIDLASFALLALVLFVIPLLTVFTCWARWPPAAVV